MKTQLGQASLFAVFVFGLAVGCGGSGGSMQDVNPIVPTMVSYTQNVQPIFNATCATAGCHAGPTVPASGNLDLSAGVSFANLVNHDVSAGCASVVTNVPRVKPGGQMGRRLWRTGAPEPT